MYTLIMTIDYYYWKCDHKQHYARQAEKEVLKSHFWKQGKASTSGSVSGGLVHQELFLQAISIPHFQEAT